ncbi:MAG: hypothetical protein KDA81_20865, partial [Planctomycetaceae bacterium]|nr:hypothetical protein [Planctomycetaceae bacterium]
MLPIGLPANQSASSESVADIHRRMGTVQTFDHRQHGWGILLILSALIAGCAGEDMSQPPPEIAARLARQKAKSADQDSGSTTGPTDASVRPVGNEPSLLQKMTQDAGDPATSSTTAADGSSPEPPHDTATESSLAAESSMKSG